MTMTALDRASTDRAPTALTGRRYRLGLAIALGAARPLRWILLAWIVLTPVMSLLLADVIETGLWLITATVFQWFVASAAGRWLYANLPGVLSRGVTRRELTTAYLVFGAIASLATTAIVTAGFAAEHALLTAAGNATGTWGGALADGARYLLITPIYCFTGALIGAAALRFAGSTLFTLVVLVAAAGQYTGVLALEFGFFDGGGNLAAWAGICLAVTAVLVAGLAATLRTAPVRAK
ncbi:hypothetical protein [Glycomyces sp. NPDC047010]|uniref:hypothetical protein n=1 Tax=Glycomyces sp. NPDC047010 TaxID=3155023 RepID=UPI0034058324